MLLKYARLSHNFSKILICWLDSLHEQPFEIFSLFRFSKFVDIERYDSKVNTMVELVQRGWGSDFLQFQLNSGQVAFYQWPLLLSVMMDKMRAICEISFSFNFSLGSDEPVVILLFWIISLLPWQQRPLGYHGYLTLWLKEKTNDINRRQKNKRKFSKKMVEDKTRISPLDSSNGKCRI